jgi:hypothetical protein
MIHWRFWLVQLQGLELRGEAFNGILQDTWTKVDFKRILNIEEQAVINLIHVKRGLLMEPRPLHKDWEKKTRFR